MKRSLGYAAAISLALACTACGGLSTSVPSSPSAKPDLRAAYLTVVRAATPLGGSDDTLTHVGATVCGVFDDGGSWDLELSAVAENGLTPAQALVLVKASVAAFCPQWKKLEP